MAACPTVWLQSNSKDLDGPFYQRTVRLLELAFDGQFHYGTGPPLPAAPSLVLTEPHPHAPDTGMFYAYVKLKEQESRNLVFLCECVLQGRTHEMSAIVPIFSRSAKWRK